MSDRYEAGMKVRRSVLGDAHVDRAEAQKTPFDVPFQDLITEGAWGTVWASDGISKRERSMITLALLAATGNFEEIPMHIRATARTGASKQDVLEAAFEEFAGVPGLLVQLSAFGRIAFDPALDPTIDMLQKNRVRAGPATPETSEQRGDEEQ